MTIAYATGAPVMMQLGAFQFGINTAAYQGLSRSEGWRWPGQDRIGQEAALQYVGPDEASISLDGVIFPEWKGGAGQLDAMRAQAARGEPLVLVNGLGRALGMWVIERIEENQSTFAAGGVARRIEFTMQLKRFSSTVTGPVPQLPPLPQPQPPIPPEATTAVQQTRSLADAAIEAAKPLADAAASAYRGLQSELAPLTSKLKDAAGGALRLAEAARQLQSVSEQARSSLKGVQGSGVIEVAQALGRNAERLRLRAESASQLLQRALKHLDSSPEQAARAVLDALGAGRKLESVCRTIAREAARIRIEEPGS